MHKIKHLLNDAILFDMTNFINSPMRTGIQRVTHQLVLHWPSDRPILPFRQVGPDRIAILAPEILIHAERYFSAGNDLVQQAAFAARGNSKHQSEGLHRMKSLAQRPLLEVDSVVAAREARALLSIELSMNIGFYGRLADEAPEKVYILNYDYILWINPEFNSNVDWTNHSDLSEYVSVLRKFPRQSFISTLTRDNYYNFIDKRCERSHPIIIPGTDGLGVARRDHTGDRAEFVVIGTIEPRKQHLRIMRAIERTQAEGIDASLTVIGKMGWLTPEDRATFERIVRDNPRIDWLDAPADDQLVTVLSRARASIFFSRTEGFGGPPVESLSLGVPIIVSDTTPSVMDLPNRGQIRVGPDDDEGLCEAIRFFADPAKARAKQDEIAELDLPTWKSFIVGISDWVDETAPLTGRPFTMRGRIDQLSLGKLIESSPSIECFLPALFRISLLREPSHREIESWLDYSEENGLDKYAFVACFLEEVVKQRPEALSLFSLILGTGETPNPQTDRVQTVGYLLFDEALSILALPQNHRVVERIYADIHRRPAGHEELAGLNTVLDANRPRSEIIVSALVCDEFRAKNPGFVLDDATRALIVANEPIKLVALLDSGENGAFVDNAYRTLLQRNADPVGRASYIAKLASGVSRNAVLLDILLSREADEGLLDIDVISGLVLTAAYSRHGGSTPLSAFTELLGTYADMVALQLLALSRVKPQHFGSAAIEVLLGHPFVGNASSKREMVDLEIDQQRRLLAISERLPISTLGGIDVKARLGSSIRALEAKKLLEEPSDIAFVNRAFQCILDRDADPKGRAAYIARLETEMTRIDMLVSLAQSAETVEHIGQDEARWIAAQFVGARAEPRLLEISQ